MRGGVFSIVNLLGGHVVLNTCSMPFHTGIINNDCDAMQSLCALNTFKRSSDARGGRNITKK